MERRLVIDPTKSYRLGKPRRAKAVVKKRPVSVRTDRDIEEE